MVLCDGPPRGESKSRAIAGAALGPQARGLSDELDTDWRLPRDDDAARDDRARGHVVDEPALQAAEEAGPRRHGNERRAGRGSALIDVASLNQHLIHVE